ncbi:hypothetical protein cypCar_00025519 [Cyprinus carpio]|nr:hypothetical protein cypCar_00025519 [Cyprinus carpio]
MFSHNALISLQVVYCGPTCQRLHWFTHKRQCKTPVPQRGNRQPKLRELSSHVDDNDVVNAASSMLALCLGLSKCALQNSPSDDHSKTSEDPHCAGKD